MTGRDAVITRFSRSPDAVGPCTDPAEEFLRLTCGPDRRPLPAPTATTALLAAAVADPAALRAVLAADPAAATREGGPFDWEPLLYLAFSRYPAFEQDVLGTAELLLAHGADPNAGFLWDGQPTPFTALTGVLGEGERGPDREPRHPFWEALATLLLQAGADSNDAQGLYNRMFTPDDAHLRLLFAHGLGAGDGGPWRVRLGDALDPPAALLRAQLRWAVTQGLAARVTLLLEHGVDAGAPYADGRTPAAVAALAGHPELVGLLGGPVTLRPGDALVAAALTCDRAEARRLRTEHPDLLARLRATRPGLLVWAATLRRPGVVALVVELGFDVNGLGRSDVPRQDPWHTALHVAAEHDDVALATALLALGADPTITDARFGGTPLGWAEHFGHEAVAAVLRV